MPGLESALLIAVTWRGRESDVARAREAGFDHHLLKPADADALETLLRAWTAQGQCRPSPVAVA
jgi:CheY-like chemotaxis protein